MANTSSSQPRPRIGISCSFEPDSRRVFVRDTYIEAVRAAGESNATVGAADEASADKRSAAAVPLTIAVNSLQHQGIDRLSAGLRAIAFAPDGLVETFEAADGRPIYAVQWHPEDLHASRPDQAELFRRLMVHCLRIVP